MWGNSGHLSEGKELSFSSCILFWIPSWSVLHKKCSHCKIIAFMFLHLQCQFSFLPADHRLRIYKNNTLQTLYGCVQISLCCMLPSSLIDKFKADAANLFRWAYLAINHVDNAKDSSRFWLFIHVCGHQHWIVLLAFGTCYIGWSPINKAWYNMTEVWFDFFLHILWKELKAL